MLIALASGKGAPGVSTTAAALAAVWPRPVLLVEADPRGGTVLYGLGQGNDAGGRGLLGLQLDARRSSLSEALEGQLTGLDWPETYLLAGVDSSRQAGSVAWGPLGTFLAEQDRFDVIADCGALPAYKAPTGVWAAADLTVLVTRATLVAAHFAEDAAGWLRNDLQAMGLGVDRLVSVVVGPGRPYPLADLETFLQDVAPVAGSVDWDPDVAAVFTEGTAVSHRKMLRSGLIRSAGRLAEKLGAMAQDRRTASLARRAPAPVTAPSPAADQPQTQVAVPAARLDTDLSTAATDPFARRGARPAPFPTSGQASSDV